MLRKSENFLALRLENVSLREPLSDLRAGNANLIFAQGVRKELGENLIVPQPIEKHQAAAALGYSRYARKFFAKPLVSELPDGFGSNANLIFAQGVRKELGENLPVPQPIEKHQAGWLGAFLLAAALGFEPRE